MGGLPQSLRDGMTVAAAAAKHSRAVRILAAPAVTLQFMRRDREYAASADSAYVKALRGRHMGERCFVVGNGPSLTVEDLEALEGEVTFASNGIFNLFERTSWRPTYYLSVDREFIMHEAGRFPGLPVERAFVNTTPFSKGLSGSGNVTLLNKRPGFYSTRKYTTENIVFSDRPDLFVAEGYTVTYTALQLALFMGFAEIYLIGTDHTYTHVADSKGVVRTIEGVVDHCYEDARGTHVNPQYKEGVEFAYLVARIAAEQAGARILNATRGGALEVFERADLDEVLAGRGGEDGR